MFMFSFSRGIEPVDTADTENNLFFGCTKDLDVKTEILILAKYLNKFACIRDLGKRPLREEALKIIATMLPEIMTSQNFYDQLSYAERDIIKPFVRIVKNEAFLTGYSFIKGNGAPLPGTSRGLKYYYADLESKKVTMENVFKKCPFSPPAIIVEGKWRYCAIPGVEEITVPFNVLEDLSGLKKDAVIKFSNADGYYRILDKKEKH